LRSSDVDKETKARLDHGAVLMEVLKQGQYSPVEVENQVMILYAAINYYLEDIPHDRIKEFEKQFTEFMDTHYPQVQRRIKDSGKLDEETEEFLKDAIEEFKKLFTDK